MKQQYGHVPPAAPAARLDDTCTHGAGTALSLPSQPRAPSTERAWWQGDRGGRCERGFHACEHTPVAMALSCDVAQSETQLAFRFFAQLRTQQADRINPLHVQRVKRLTENRTCFDRQTSLKPSHRKLDTLRRKSGTRVRSVGFTPASPSPFGNGCINVRVQLYLMCT